MKRWMPALATLGVLVISSAGWACPMCKDSLPNSDAASATMVPGAVNNSIYLMFAGFAAMLAMICWTLVQGARGSRIRAARGFSIDDQKIDREQK